MAGQHVVYKVVGDLEIKFTITLPENAKNVAILLFLHGFGGLLQGSRDEVPRHVRESVEKYNLALISADYRLAPQANISDIDHDVNDCIDFIRSSEGLVKQLENPGAVDTTRLAVSGNAAGGYLALIAGLYAEPKPQVILAMYPITDPLGTFFKSDQVYATYYEDEEPYDLSRCVDYATIRRYLNPEPVVSHSQGTNRDKLYHWVLGTGDYASYLKFEGVGESEYKNWVNETHRIAKQVPEYGLPPTYICHGTDDVEIGVEQSDELAGALFGAKMDVEYDRMKGKGHMFDVKDDLGMDEMYAFMKRYL